MPAARNSSGKSGDDADGIELRIGAQYHQRHPEDADEARDHLAPVRLLGEHHGSESQREHRRDRAEYTGNATGQAVGGQEEQREERADMGIRHRTTRCSGVDIRAR